MHVSTVDHEFPAITSECDIHAFPNLPPETSNLIQQGELETFLRARSKAVHFVCGDPCAQLGEVHVWDSFSVNNTCLIAPNLSAHCVCKLPGNNACGAKGRITNASGLQAHSQVAPRQWEVMRQEAAATCGASLKGHFGRGVHTDASYVHSPLPLPPPRRLFIMCSLVLTQLWGAPKFTGRRGEGGGWESNSRYWGQRDVFSFPALPLFCLSLCLLFVMIRSQVAAVKPHNHLLPPSVSVGHALIRSALLKWNSRQNAT